MYARRRFEPEYALLPEQAASGCNRYGKPLQLAGRDDPLTGQSLRINGDNAIGAHPNRYLQHGFYFNADNCIACHACESACSEKNNLPAHLAFRAVGYVEGGTWPDYRRINISMACNHCDDPVCLKGCPTRAYTKFAEYGAVLQDPDICFGCGYCTWVCPYNAPQLDPVEGHVQKCNMCVDRLEVGLKPACVSACLAGALDFGVVETKPDKRDQLETKIPGFPTPDITHPNIRFQQTRSLPREMVRTDAVPLMYVRDAKGSHQPKLRGQTFKRTWNLAKLRTREDPLVVFTLVSQAVVGAFLMLFLGPLLGLTQLASDAHPKLQAALLFTMLAAQSFALALSTFHLGKPHRFYRAFNNLRYSPVSREVAGIAVFYNFLGVYTILELFPALSTLLPMGWGEILRMVSGTGAAVAGPAAIYFMHRIYRIPARPFWNHWQTASSFFGNVFSLGAGIIGFTYAVTQMMQGIDIAPVLTASCALMALGIVIEAIGLSVHHRAMEAEGAEGAASHHVQRTEFGRTYLARNFILGLALLAAILTTMAAPIGIPGVVSLGFTLVLVFTAAVIGRALFYALVIPTTMPGAFFWRNQKFQEHARKAGISLMPQAGVVHNLH